MLVAQFLPTLGLKRSYALSSAYIRQKTVANRLPIIRKRSFVSKIMSELESSIGPASEIFQPAEVPSVVTADTVNAEVPVAKKIRLTKAEKRAAAEERRKQYWKSKVRCFWASLGLPFQ